MLTRLVPLLAGAFVIATYGARAAAATVEAPAIVSGMSAGVFVDAMKQASPWSSAQTLDLDRLGNVVALAPGQTAESTIFAAGTAYPSGDYTLLYDGQGTFEVSGATIAARATGRLVVHVAAPSPGGLRLRLVATERNDYARAIRLIEPGFEAIYAKAPFRPEFVRSLASVPAIRFKDWSHADTFVRSATWPARPTTNRFTQAGADGVAAEYMIALANATGAEPWFTLPAGATDYYIFSFAQLVHRALDPRLRPIFEYGADALGPQTPGNAWARMAGTNFHLAADPAAAATAWYTLRSRQTFNLVRSAFGADAGRVVRAPVRTPSSRSPGSWRPDAHFAFQPSPSEPDAFERPRSRTPSIVPPPGQPNYRPQPDGGQPQLTGSVGVPLETVDLTREGTTDWAYYGHGDTAHAARKAAAIDGLGQLAALPGARPQHTTEGYATYIWRDGGASATAGRQTGGLAVAGQRSGFALTAPADRTLRTLRIYVGAEGAKGAFTATLSDRSARPYSDASLDARSDATDGVYSLVYRATRPNEHVTVTFTNAAAGGRVWIEAATLQTAGVRPAQSPSSVVTFHNDTMRWGWNQTETTLTTANVATGGFGLLKTLSVDGVVLAQPLYVAQYNVPGQGVHNLLVVATEHDTIYEFDADTYGLINKRSLGTSQSSSDVGCSDIRPEYGITSTPVIDPSTNTIYVVAANEPSHNSFRHTIHALDIGTLNDQQSPVDVSASVMMSNGSQITFDPQNQQSRTSLAFAGGALYVGIGSHCDNNADAVVGWMLKYDQTLHQTAAFATAEDSTGYLLTSIWMTGYASAIDGKGNLYAITGNGAFDADRRGGRNYGESVIRVDRNLTGVSTYFTPSDWAHLNQGDTDFGSGGVMLLPRQQAKPPFLAVAMGKDSRLFMLNRAKMGHVGKPFQELNAGGGGVWGGPAFFSGPTGQFVYYQTGGAVMKAYRLSKVGSHPQLAVASQGNSAAGYGGSSPVVSSNGQNPGTGILWTVHRDRTLALEAYDATDLTKLLFAGNAGAWSNPQNNGFVTPLVANGKVYVPASGTVTVFGLP